MAKFHHFFMNPLLIYVIGLFMRLPSTYATPSNEKRLPVQQKKASLEQLSIKEKLTVFIHGTKFPIISQVMHEGKLPRGFVPMTFLKNGFKRIGSTLSSVAPSAFPLDSFYFYGWSGSLNFNERKKAAQELYDTLCNHHGPLTLIAHSHGCNVVLNLAKIAQKKENNSFVVDKLILLAPPVQKATAHYVTSPIFKTVVSLYSTADIMQIADPQGLYYETFKEANGKELPLFSKRTFDEQASNNKLIQVRVLFDKHSPGHQTFIVPRFMKHLPAIIELAEEAALKSNNRNLTVNIPPHESPQIMKKLKLAYEPRTTPRNQRKKKKLPLIA